MVYNFLRVSELRRGVTADGLMSSVLKDVTCRNRVICVRI